MKKLLGWLGVGLLGLAVLVKPVSGQDLTTQLSKFLVDLRAGTLGVNQPITSLAVGAVSTTGNGVALTASGRLFVGNNIVCGNGTPSISSGFGTSPSVASSNGTCTFRVNVGGGGAATSGVVTLGDTATTGWNCQVTDFSNNTVTRQTNQSTTTVTVTAAAAWAANDILIFNCAGF
jgi:hypothetical protein